MISDDMKRLLENTKPVDPKTMPPRERLNILHELLHELFNSPEEALVALRVIADCPMSKLGHERCNEIQDNMNDYVQRYFMKDAPEPLATSGVEVKSERKLTPEEEKLLKLMPTKVAAA